MDTTFETVNELLRAVQESVEDPEASFKLRTARQLLMAIENTHTAGKQTVLDADLDQKTLEKLRGLGYID